jgi:hypothetical protein
MSMLRKLVLPIALAAGVLTAGTAAEARDGCGPGGHRGVYGWCRPNVFYRPIVRVPVYGYRPVYGYGPRWHRWGGYRHGGWHHRW